MKITVNSKTVDTDATDILQLAGELALPQGGVALAMDGAMVPREQWGQTPLHEGAQILVIRAACGG